MKARDARLHYFICYILAFVAVFTSSAIFSTVFASPFIIAKAREFMEKARANRKENLPAIKAAKAKADALKKEKAQLEKDKKALEKKKLNARKVQAKKIYEERKKKGYEATAGLVAAEARAAIVAEASMTLDDVKKPKKAPKLRVDTPVLEQPASIEEAVPIAFDSVLEQPAPIEEAVPIAFDSVLEQPAPIEETVTSTVFFPEVAEPEAEPMVESIIEPEVEKNSVSTSAPIAFDSILEQPAPVEETVTSTVFFPEVAKPVAEKPIAEQELPIAEETSVEEQAIPVTEPLAPVEGLSAEPVKEADFIATESLFRGITF
ncbi:MAG: hypothetical protein GX241_02480 [Ruminococcaceae bacterium]|nr:hypothetical protein [Oscillospiraceae bacterium]